MKYKNQRINAIKQQINKDVSLIEVACELLDLNFNDADDVIEQSSRYIIFSPFRDDGSKPSFHILKANNRWVDRASNESGDIFDFVMRVKECGFFHAFTFLAQKAGVDIQDLTASFDDDPQTKVEAVMNFVGNLCANELKRSEEVLNTYCEETGLSDVDVIRYRVGYCPTRDWLVTNIYENFKDITDKFLSSIGLMKAERLEGAMVFPIVSADGSYNRIYTKPRNKINKDDPKYWSQFFSEEYKKHYDDGAMFGLSAVKGELKRTKHLYICEGYKQAMAVGGVAIMGTRFSEKQVKTLERLGVEKISVCFDGDDAGREATYSLMSRPDIIDKFECRVVPLPKGKQIDDILREEGMDDVKETLEKSVPLFDFVLDGSLDVSDPENYEDCLYATARMAHDLNPAHVFYLADWFAKRFKVPVEPIRDWLFTNISNDTETQVIKNSQAETDLCVYVARDSGCLDIARLDGVKTNMFTSFICRTIYEIALRCYDFIGDAYTVQNVLDMARTNKDWENFYAEISSMLDNDHKFKYEPNVASRLVISCNSRRNIRSSLLELGTLASDLSFDYNTHVDKVLTSVTDSTNKNPLPTDPEDVVAAAERRIEEAKANSTGVLGYDVSCISPILNQNLSGICKYTYTVLGGQTGTGKSLLAANLIRPLVFGQKIPWLWINLEMDPMSLAFRFWAMESGLSESRIKLGKIHKPEELEALEEAKRSFRESKLFIDKPATPTPEAVYSLIRKYHNEKGIGGVTIDYIQLVATSNNSESREGVIGRMSKLFMNNVTQNMGLPVLAVSQQNRERGSARTAEGIGGSYQISQDAHNLVLISKADPNDPSVPTGANRIITIAKARNAPDGLDFAGKYELEDPDSLRYSDFVQLPVV